MRSWKLTANDPISLTIAADTRLTTPDYHNDHIWELHLEGGEPTALNLRTSFGLRAGWLRLFPRFLKDSTVVVDPAAFAKPPVIQHFYPNYLSLAYAPFQGIDAVAEYWVPTSQTAAGRLHLSNRSVLKEKLRIEWAGLLSPLGEGESLSAVQTGAGYVLRGKTENLYPVLYLTGAPRPVHSPYPALALEIELFPGAQFTMTWALATLTDPQAALEMARQVTAAPWEGEIARIHMQNQSHGLEITTGDPDWDAAFAFAQRTAYGLFMPGGQLNYPTFVLNRLPEQGYSMRGDGSDYGYLWGGQTALDAWYLTSLILPGGADLAEGVLRNFLQTQSADGSIDWKPGAAGQRSRRMAQPLLASLALRIDQHKKTHDWLAEIYPALLQFFKAWLDPKHDLDNDGFPEWEHAGQTGYEDNPLFERWDRDSQGIEIARVECPSLPALLYREARSLLRMAQCTGQFEDIPWLEEQAARLRAIVQSTWSAADSAYHLRDFETHRIPTGETLAVLDDNGKITLKHAFKQPERLLLTITTRDETTRTASITLRGRTKQGAVVERIEPTGFFWTRGVGRATTRHAYKSINRVEISGLTPGDRTQIATLDLTGESLLLLLPLWAGIPDPQQAETLLKKTLLERYCGPYGIPMSPPASHSAGPVNPAYVYMHWNQLLGEAMLNYGLRLETADLVTRLMNAVIPTLRQQRAFRQFYHAQTGQPFGERNMLTGLPPLSLFLQAAGIDRIAPDEILISGFNPFPWAITVKYRGMTIVRHQNHTVVTYPSGQTITLDGEGKSRLSLT